MTNFKRFKYYDLNVLPRSIKKEVENLLAKKTDDFLKIIRTHGYEIWVWTKDLPIQVSCY